MELNEWTRKFRAAYDKAVRLYGEGRRGAETYFNDEEKNFLASIGVKPINVYDYAEDFDGSGEPDWDTALLMVAARRDYFLYEQHGKSAARETQESELPPRKAELGGIAWLPRIIVKAACFLQGGLCTEIMYCCGGDRDFLKSHNIHPADFLRVVWASHGDDQKILKFVKSSQGG